MREKFRIKKKKTWQEKEIKKVPPKFKMQSWKFKGKNCANFEKLEGKIVRNIKFQNRKPNENFKNRSLFIKISTTKTRYAKKKIEKKARKFKI